VSNARGEWGFNFPPAFFAWNGPIQTASQLRERPARLRGTSREQVEKLLWAVPLGGYGSKKPLPLLPQEPPNFNLLLAAHRCGGSRRSKKGEAL